MEIGTLDRPAGAEPQEPVTEPETPEQPDTPEEPAAQEPGEELYTEGDDGYLNSDFGGKQPTDSKLQIVGRSVAIEGQFKKGARIRAVVELEIGGGKVQDKKDGQTGQVVACTRTHYASIVGFARQS